MMTDNTVVTSSSFYTSCEQTDNSSLVYNNADVNDLLVSTSSGAHAPPSHLENIATSPHLDSGNELEQLCPFRLRSHSAPSVLYEQVALQLRDISDEFNQEYSRDEVQKKIKIFAVTNLPIPLALHGACCAWYITSMGMGSV